MACREKVLAETALLDGGVHGDGESMHLGAAGARRGRQCRLFSVSEFALVLGPQKCAR